MCAICCYIDSNLRIQKEIPAVVKQAEISFFLAPWMLAVLPMEPRLCLDAYQEPAIEDRHISMLFTIKLAA